jgi:DNA-binding response OmpR family regulator
MEDLKRILIVDDSPTVIEHVKLLLKDYNVKLNTAGSSFGMYQNIESYGNLTDLILMDLTLKKEHGLDLIEDLRANEKYKNIPIIIVTEYVTMDFIMRAKKLSVSHYIKKPIKKDLLIARIQEIINIYDLNEMNKGVETVEEESTENINNENTSTDETVEETRDNSEISENTEEETLEEN